MTDMRATEVAILTDGPCMGRRIVMETWTPRLLVPIDQSKPWPPSEETAGERNTAEYGHVGNNLYVFNKVI